jgi:uncharacterized tellurite resistance protein B-like protein
MIRQLFDRINDHLSATDDGEDSAQEREAAIRTATAVLMIDVARADENFDDEELGRILSSVRREFGLSDADASQLIDSADEHAKDLVSLHSFTDLLHRHLEEHEKARIVGHLWKVAYADGDLHKLESSLILKISDLLHVSRGRVMRLKHDAEVAAGS